MLRATLGAHLRHLGLADPGPHQGWSHQKTESPSHPRKKTPPKCAPQGYRSKGGRHGSAGSGGTSGTTRSHSPRTSVGTGTPGVQVSIKRRHPDTAILLRLSGFAARASRASSDQRSRDSGPVRVLDKKRPAGLTRRW